MTTQLRLGGMLTCFMFLMAAQAADTDTFHPTRFEDLAPQELYEVTIYNANGTVLIKDQIPADNRGRLATHELLTKTQWMDNLYNDEENQDEFLRFTVSRDGILLEDAEVPVEFIREPEFWQSSQQQLAANKAGIVFPILWDPSTYLPNSCRTSHFVNYNLPGFGSTSGRIYRPISGTCTSTNPPPRNSPVVLLLNGAGYNYWEYSYLAWHLAGNGFVVVSVQADEPNPLINCGGPGAICIEDRARRGVAFLNEVRQNFTWANYMNFENLAVVGHSRGGEAAVEAASVIRWEEASLGNPGVNAVIAIAPTDVGDDGLTGRRKLLGRESDSFLVLYGSRDEQIRGWAMSIAPPFILPHQTGFALYDRAGTEGSLEGIPISLDNQVEKTMQFVYEANHDQFSNRCGNPICIPVLPCATQQKISKGMVNGFLRWKLLGTTGYQSYFDGTIKKPWGEEIWPQFSDGDWYSRRVIDNFQDGEWQTSTMGGNVVTSGGANMDIAVEDVFGADPRSLHGPADMSRMVLSPHSTSASNLIQWTIPSNYKNVENFTHLSFRIGLSYDANSAASVSVRMKRGWSWSAVIDTLPYGEIPEADKMGPWNCPGYEPERAILHMRTIRIPLDDFGGDLSNVQNVQIRLDRPGTQGHDVYIDNVEFTGGTASIGF